MIEKSSASLQWFENSTKDLSLYFYLYDRINGNTNFNMEEYKVRIQEFNDGTVLKDIEKEEVITKVESKIKTEVEKYKALKLFDNKLIIINEDQEQYFNKKYHLSRKKVLIPLFQEKNDNLVCGYAQVSILQKDNSKKEAFILEKDWEHMKEEHFPLIAKGKKLNGLLLDEKKVKEIQNSVTNNFKWPETELAEKPVSVIDQNDDKSLNENSALKLMGYQITGLTRAKRWEILQKAVPTLSLRKVANIIAYNVRLRKGQKNGINKYHNAITEWEYDLAKLKKEYYKKDFSWPTV